MRGPVWSREHYFEWDGTRIHQKEDFFVAHHDGTVDATLNSVDPVEAATSRGLRWWPIEELGATRAERFVPASLAYYAELLLLDGVPDSPYDVGV